MQRSVSYLDLVRRGRTIRGPPTGPSLLPRLPPEPRPLAKHVPEAQDDLLFFSLNARLLVPHRSLTQAIATVVRSRLEQSKHLVGTAHCIRTGTGLCCSRGMPIAG